MGFSRDMPPSDWPGMEMTGMARLTDDIYYGWLGDEPNPMLWHWCAALPDDPELTVSGRWIAAGTGAHTVVCREPLHLEPSLLWACCGLHGFVRDGVWVPA